MTTTAATDWRPAESAPAEEEVIVAFIPFGTRPDVDTGHRHAEDRSCIGDRDDPWCLVDAAVLGWIPKPQPPPEKIK